MINDEIISLREEIFKEIRNVEQKLNLQITIKTQDITEKNNKFVEEYNTMVQKNKTLLNTITSQNIQFDKINDFDNFRKKTESMMITHEIRINNTIKDIKDIQFKLGKEIHENFNVPGFIGPSCKYKTLASFLSSNINEIEKIKNDIEINKKDNKEIKRKIEEIIKKVVNLVDGSNSKCIDYTDKKINDLKEIVKKRLDEFSDKIIDFKSLLMTQKRIDDIHENIYRNIQTNHYDKKEIDNIINNILNKFEINLDSFRANYNEDLNNFVKKNNEKLENEIKVNSKSLKDIKMKLITMTQTQNQLLKNNSSRKNSKKNNNNEINIKDSYKSNYFNSSFNNYVKNYNGEEEKYSKFRNLDYVEKNKTIDTSQLNNKINSLYYSTEPNQLKDKKEQIIIDNTINDNNMNNNNNENTKNLNNSLSKIERQKQKINEILNSEENKNSISDYKYKLDTSKNNINLINETDINKTPSLINRISKKIENKKNTFILKKYNKNYELFSHKNNHNNHNNQNNLSNMLAFGINDNDKAVITSIDSENTIKNLNKESDKIIKINDKKHNIKSISKKGGFSLRKLASIDFGKKVNEILPNMISNKNIDYKSRNPKTPVVKNVFHQTYQTNINNKMKDNISLDVPVKIMSSFGRTGYTYYDKKEEGINNLINKGIKNTIKKYKNNSTDINLGLSPVTKITVYGNI